MCLHDEHAAQSRTNGLGRVLVAASAPAASSTTTGSGGSCLTPSRVRADEDVAADGGREAADDLADRRGEDVDAADDQHVVGPADAADPRARPPQLHGLVRTSTWSRVRKRRSGAAR